MVRASHLKSASSAAREQIVGCTAPLRARWWIVPLLGLFSYPGLRETGNGFPSFWLALPAGCIFLYNGLFLLWFRRSEERLIEDADCRKRFIFLQAAFDTAALSALCLLTGGTASPFIIVFAVPIVWFTTALNARMALTLLALSVGALIGIALIEKTGWVLPQGLNGGRSAFQIFSAIALPVAAFVAIVFFGTFIKGIAHREIDACDRRLESEERVNQRLQSLLSSLQAIGSARKLEEVLHTVTSEFARVMQVKGVSVKLLSDDCAGLHYAAAFGLPHSFTDEKIVEVAKSPLNKRILDGEPFVTGQVTEGELFQFGEALSSAHIRSVLFLPLHLESRVIGILGAYAEEANRFSQEDVEFFGLASRMVAIALENARAYGAIKTLNDERIRFMLRVTHNLRAPLAAMLSILEVTRGGYLGPLNSSQAEYLRRLDRRARTMLAMVNELMTLSKRRSHEGIDLGGATDPAALARRVRRTFQDEAAGKSILFNLSLAENLAPIRGPLEIIEQLLENLISNALKYTPAGGKVTVNLKPGAGMAVIEVSDTGIGIPPAEKSKLFTEFFRASNAKSVEEIGTGLGLAIVKEIVDGLGGRILVESEEKMGSVFVIYLPLARAGPEPDAAAG